jgi:hypothetical protein
MASYNEPRIKSAERLAEGIVIAFDDGKFGFYSASLLYATLAQAEELDDSYIDE